VVVSGRCALSGALSASWKEVRVRDRVRARDRVRVRVRVRVRARARVRVRVTLTWKRLAPPTPQSMKELNELGERPRSCGVELRLGVSG
jgi:hypothetical protein